MFKIEAAKDEFCRKVANGRNLSDLSDEQLRALHRYARTRYCRMFEANGGESIGTEMFDRACGAVELEEMNREAFRMSVSAGEWKVSSACTRCGGAGRLSGYQHVNGGVCYGCKGSGQKAA